MPFLSFLSPFIYLLLYFFFLFCPGFIPCLVLSFLTSHFSPLPFSTFLFDIFFSTLFLWSLSCSILSPDLQLTCLYMCVYIYLYSTPDLPFSSWNKKITYADSLILLHPFLSTWNTLLLPILKHMYWVDWRIMYVGNVPKFRSGLEKAARSGCIVNRAVTVLPLAVPEEDCKPPELKDRMAFSSHFQISDFW